MSPEEKISELKNTILQICVETWRFNCIFEKIIKKLDAQDQKRYISQFSWFNKKMEDAMSSAGYRLVDLRGRPYEPGVAAQAINLDEFNEDESLFIDQVLEPTIMDDNGNIVKIGTVTLAKEIV